MRILILGSGGREHALAHVIRQSSRVSELFVAPGNAGIEALARCVALDIQDNNAVLEFCRKENIELVVVGPEAPLVNGVVDALERAGIKAFGPHKNAAQLEGSKAFMKAMCARHNIDTAKFETFSAEQLSQAKTFARSLDLPVVIKADGLAAGKGVIIATSYEEAERTIEQMLSGESFGDAGRTVVIEEFLDGEEISVFALVDGKTALWFGSAQDHKRVGDGDTGPNTGGMGTYAPAPVLTPELERIIQKEILQKTVDGMRADGTPYHGVLFAGIMVTKRGPVLLEFNVRFGDPETQVLMARLRSDLVEHMLATVDGNLAKQKIEISPDAALCVVMAANGYPDAYEKNTEIKGLENAGALPNTFVFHAGTKRASDGKILAIGGRVLGITALGKTVKEAQTRAYEAVDKINWPGGFCRRDIGWRAIGRG